MPIPIFEDLCRKYVQQHGKDSLIAPISQDSSRDCAIFNVVEKRKRKLIYTTQIEYKVRELKIFDILDESLQLEDFECNAVEAGEWVFKSEQEHSLSFVFRWAKSLLGLFTTSSHTHFNNVNVVAEDITKKNDFIKMLNNRKIKLEDPCIKDRKDDNSVMCVIIGVRKTKDEVVIERIDGQSGNMSADVKDSKQKINANSSDKTETRSKLPKNTTLAYKVFELKIDLTSGAIHPCWDSIDEAGFFYKKSGVKKTSTLNNDARTSINEKKSSSDTDIEKLEKKALLKVALRTPESSNMDLKQEKIIPLLKCSNSESSVSYHMDLKQEKIIPLLKCSNSESSEPYHIKKLVKTELLKVVFRTPESSACVEEQTCQKRQDKLEPLQYIQYQLEPLPHKQDQLEPLPHKQDQLEPLPHKQDQLEPLPHKQDQLEPLPHKQDQLEPLQHMPDQLDPFHYMQAQLKPLRCYLLEDDTIRSSLLQLMTCRNDLALLSKMLDKAERGQLREQTKRYQKSANKDALFKIFYLAGFEIKHEEIVYERKPKEILKAVAYIVGAMCDVDEKYLVEISQCSEKQLKALEKIFRIVISSKMTADVTIDNEIKPALEKPAKNILTDMDFGLRFYSWTILPPKTHTEVHECIYCILYCFS